MFIRRKKMPAGRIKIQIVESMRTRDKVRQKVLRHVGTATSEAQLEALERLAHVVLEEMRQEASGMQALLSPREMADLATSRHTPSPARTPPVDVMNCSEDGRITVGIRDVFSIVYRQFGWERLLGARRMSANRIIQELVLARIAQPQSKRATVREWYDHGTMAIHLDRVYRSMDGLDDRAVETVCQRSLEMAQTLVSGSITAVFYDVTTLAFASEQADALRQKGYSKDGKSHRVQILLALLVTPEGLPVGYEVFPGNRFEGPTLMTALEGLERRHPGLRVTVVADAAMITQANEAALRERGTPYILGARLRSSPAAWVEPILDRDGYEPWGSHDGADSIGGYRCLDVDHDRRLIVTHSPRRARKDAHDRARQIEKLRARLARSARPAAQGNRGMARFLDFPDGTVQLNADKVAAIARWDGLRGIMTWGCDTTDPRTLIGQYRKLATIEACFRTNKHDLKIRPIFHWREPRIRAHIALCYMAFCCLQHLRHRLALRGHPMSPERIRRALNALQISLLHDPHGDQRIGLPSAITADAKEIYRTLGLRWRRQPFLIEPRPPPPGP